VRGIWLSAFAILAPAGAAWAGSHEVQYGAPAAWVAAPPGPTNAAAPEGAAVRMVYTDFQIRMTPSGDENYTAYRMKILTPEGLAAANVVAGWNPSTDDILIHRLRLIRGDKVIDVLADNKFEVIQRENNLENNMLDGQLTAALQIPGVEVGDELEFAATLRRSETVFANRSHGFAQLPMVSNPGAHRVRLLWPGDKKVRWSASSDLGKLAVQNKGGQNELDVELKAPASVVLADDAPDRFNIRRLIEYTEFADWSEVSGLMAPLFDKASQLAADSPIRAEVARIAKTSADPEARARAALQLVQDRIRYVYVGLDGGNYRPAAADDTWKRRFGDCKAKTALLMALLRELGIQSEAVLVNSKGIDGADQRLPTPQVFDHVLVRAAIAGKTYWLDGTRLGERRLSPSLQVPSRWVLPVKAAAAKLEAVPVEALTLPRTSELVDLDVTAGIGKPAKVYMEEVNRTDAAPGMRVALAGLSKEDADRQLKAYWRQENPWLQPAAVSWRYDDLQQAIILTARGEGKLDWDGDDKSGHSLDVMGAGFTPPNEKKRPAEQDQAAPWVVDFPKFSRWTTIIRLPPASGKRRWYLYDDPVDLKLGGDSYHREAELVGDVVRSTMSIRSYMPEITSAQAAEVNAKLPTFNNKISKVYEADAQPEQSLADQEKAAGKDATKLTSVGAGYFSRSQWSDALRVFSKALAADPNNLSALSGKAQSLERSGDTDGALKTLDVDADVGIRYLRSQVLLRAKRKNEGLAEIQAMADSRPGQFAVLRSAASEMANAGEDARALPMIDAALKLEPDDFYAQTLRAQILERGGRHEEALRDLDAAMQVDPEYSSAILERGVVLSKLGRNQEALADMEEAWRINPLNGAVAATNADLLRKLGRAVEATALFDAWIARDRSGQALNARCWARALGNVELGAAESDCARAVEMSPKAGAIWDSYALVAVRQGKLEDAIKRYDKALELSPKLASSLYGRAYAKLKAGDKAGSGADLAAATAITPKAGDEFIAAGLAVK
jgi:tetratricopeptide (TPR) repeat protein